MAAWSSHNSFDHCGVQHLSFNVEACVQLSQSSEVSVADILQRFTFGYLLHSLQWEMASLEQPQ